MIGYIVIDRVVIGRVVGTSYTGCVEGEGWRVKVNAKVEGECEGG